MWTPMERTQIQHVLPPSEVLAALVEVCVRMGSERDLRTLLDMIATEAARLLGAERASLFLAEEGSSDLVGHVALGSNEPIRVPAGQGVVGSVFANGDTVVIEDPYQDPRFYAAVDKKTGFRTRNLLATPLEVRAGSRIGVFEVLNKRQGPFTAADSRLLRSLAANAALAIENARLIAELEKRRRVLENENRQLRQELGGVWQGPALLGNTPQIVQLRKMIERVAPANITVLVTGESGTGKDLVARSLHALSPRSSGPYVALNCAALPETLVETELFGVERGVATGVEKRIGKFEAANGGTLFLDEIGDLTLASQAKILRALQQGEVERIGSHKPIKVDVRVVAATNRDLEEAMHKGDFREDLYYRLNVVRLKTPALREIRADIPLLARHFLAVAARELEMPEPALGVSVLESIIAYPWPGNARQLENEMKRLVVVSIAGQAEVDDLSPEILSGDVSPSRKEPDPPPSARPAAPGSLPDEVESLERRRIAEMLAACGYNQQKTARQLGLSRQGLINKVKRYGIATNAAGDEG
ncbi:MAG: sigma-54-dependent Fis family transcriptional regulator [Bryobacteraceae bacterium]|nr:sigma-54-dependent Fis family transcriptional regulator [Bryobacteraceae bacterium]